MKILIVVPNDSLGGAEQYLKMVASYYAQKGADIDIIFFRATNMKQWKDLEDVCNLKFMSKRNEVNGIFRFVFFILKNHPKVDYIFTSHIYSNSLLGLLRKIRAIKSNRLISRESTSIFLRYKGFKLLRYKIIYQLGYKNIDLLICQTDLMKQQLLRHLSFLNNRIDIRIIENPIDLKYIKEKSVEPMSINIKGNYIVSAGRLIHEKGFDNLIKAFNEIRLMHENLKLVILGDGQLKIELLDLVKSLNIEDVVIFTGHVNNVYPYFNNANLCVVSSRIEGFPNVLLQMMSQNEKVVSTLCAGGIHTIDGVFTCESDNVKALSKALNECLITNTKNKKKEFDAYLGKRSIDQFIHRINNAIT